MLTNDQINTIYNSIPTDYSVLDDTYDASIRYANQWNKEDYPAIILNYSEHSMEPNPLMSGELELETENDTYTTTYYDSQDVYEIEPNDVSGINEVTGIKDGDPYTFPDSSYDFIDYSGDEDGIDSIEWTDDNPDHETEFTVDFDKYMFVFKKSKIYYDRLHINVYDDSSNPLVAREICREIENEMITKKFSDMVISNISSIESLSNLDTAMDHVFRYHFYMDINHSNIEYGELSPRIANIVYEVNTNGL